MGIEAGWRMLDMLSDRGFCENKHLQVMLGTCKNSEEQSKRVKEYECRVMHESQLESKKGINTNTIHLLLEQLMIEGRYSDAKQMVNDHLHQLQQQNNQKNNDKKNEIHERLHKLVNDTLNMSRLRCKKLRGFHNTQFDVENGFALLETMISNNVATPFEYLELQQQCYSVTLQKRLYSLILNNVNNKDKNVLEDIHNSQVKGESSHNCFLYNPMVKELMIEGSYSEAQHLVEVIMKANGIDKPHKTTNKLLNMRDTNLHVLRNKKIDYLLQNATIHNDCEKDCQAFINILHANATTPLPLWRQSNNENKNIKHKMIDEQNLSNYKNIMDCCQQIIDYDVFKDQDFLIDRQQGPLYWYRMYNELELQYVALSKLRTEEFFRIFGRGQPSKTKPQHSNNTLHQEYSAKRNTPKFKGPMPNRRSLFLHKMKLKHFNLTFIKVCNPITYGTAQIKLINNLIAMRRQWVIDGCQDTHEFVHVFVGKTCGVGSRLRGCQHILAERCDPPIGYIDLTDYGGRRMPGRIVLDQDDLIRWLNSEQSKEWMETTMKPIQQNEYGRGQSMTTYISRKKADRPKEDIQKLKKLANDRFRSKRYGETRKNFLKKYVKLDMRIRNQVYRDGSDPIRRDTKEYTNVNQNVSFRVSTKNDYFDGDDLGEQSELTPNFNRKLFNLIPSRKKMKKSVMVLENEEGEEVYMYDDDEEEEEDEEWEWEEVKDYDDDDDDDDDDDVEDDDDDDDDART